jgi:membrane-associated HD superfamily phosphohydrolase
VAAFGLSLIISLSTVADLSHCFTLISICVAGVLPLRRIKSRLVIIRAGFLVAFVAFVTVWSLGLLQQPDDVHAWKNPALLVPALKFAGWALVCSYFVAGSLPFIEQAFGIVTDISLLELTGVSHPLLQELARRAPGTYNHSIMVASMAEAAAESIAPTDCSPVSVPTFMTSAR